MRQSSSSQPPPPPPSFPQPPSSSSLSSSSLTYHTLLGSCKCDPDQEQRKEIFRQLLGLLHCQGIFVKTCVKKPCIIMLLKILPAGEVWASVSSWPIQLKCSTFASKQTTRLEIVLTSFICRYENMNSYEFEVVTQLLQSLIINIMAAGEHEEFRDFACINVKLITYLTLVNDSNNQYIINCWPK